MQIMESTDWAVRTARLGLTSTVSDVRVTLFPMLHVGEPGFFETVYSDAFSHDVVLVEGLRSPIVGRITRSYRWVELSTRLKLVVQPHYPSQASCKARIVEADLSGAEFAKVWREVPLWLRAFMWLAAPVIGAERRWRSTRRSLAKGLSLDDLTSRHETLSWSPKLTKLNHAIMHAQDAHLLERLNDQLDDCEGRSRDIAIVYGAYHMRAVLRELTQRRKYHVARGDWLTVFRL